MIEKHVFGPIKHAAPADFYRADLEFYGINHFRPSYTAHVFFNDPDVTEKTASEGRPSYAGSFSIFGHQTCSGDEGHCDAHEHLRRFDDRPSHPLTRAFKRVLVTDALRRVQSEGEDLTITVVVSTDPSVDLAESVLDFTGMQLSTFG